MPRTRKNKQLMKSSNLTVDSNTNDIKSYKINRQHTLFCSSKKEFKNQLRSMITETLKSMDKSCSDSELKSYSSKELKLIFNRLNTVNNLNYALKESYLYRTSVLPSNPFDY
jgi:hypothetical protein